METISLLLKWLSLYDLKGQNTYRPTLGPADQDKLKNLFQLDMNNKFTRDALHSVSAPISSAAHHVGPIGSLMVIPSFIGSGQWQPTPVSVSKQPGEQEGGGSTAIEVEREH